MLRLGSRHALLTRQYRPRRFHGDILLFAATQARHASPKSWRPYVTGRIRVHDIPCRHPQMTDPIPIGTIGQLLNEYLQQSQKCR
jgi:thioesterase domain-containing protein